MIHLSPVAKEAAVALPPRQYIRSAVNKLNLNWHSPELGRTFSAVHCDLMDEVNGTLYESFSMAPNAQYIRGGRRYISNGTFEVCLDALIEFLEENLPPE